MPINNLPNDSHIRQRFEERIELIPFSTCWWWTGHLSRGYGQFWIGNRGKGERHQAHRLSWIIHNGEIPDGMQVLHNCQNKGHFEDNRSCVNPEHLFLGTHKDNMADMVNKGHSDTSRGEQKHSAKITELDVIKIRILVRNGAKQKDIASQFGLHPGSISVIVKRINWKHVQ